MSLRQFTAGVLMITFTGCTTVRPVASPRDFLNSRQPGRIWVTADSPTEQEIDSPKVLADTVFGFATSGEPITMPIASIKELRASQIHTARTAGIVVLVLAGGAAAISAFQGLKGDSEPEITEDARPLFKIAIPLFKLLGGSK
jgi:hypothetical protein